MDTPTAKWTRILQDLIFHPTNAWGVIAEDDNLTNWRVISGYLMKFAAVAPAFGLVVGIVVGNTRGLFSAVLSFYAVLLIAVLGLALGFAISARLFRGRSSFNGALRLVTFGFSPALVACSLTMIPGIRFFGLVGLYSLYTLYLGIPILMKVERQRSLTYGFTSCVALVVSLWLAYSTVAYMAERERSSLAHRKILSQPERNIFGLTKEEADANVRDYERQVAESEERQREFEEQQHSAKCYSYQSASVSSSNPDEKDGWATASALEGC